MPGILKHSNSTSSLERKVVSGPAQLDLRKATGYAGETLGPIHPGDAYITDLKQRIEWRSFRCLAKRCTRLIEAGRLANRHALVCRAAFETTPN